MIETAFVSLLVLGSRRSSCALAAISHFLLTFLPSLSVGVRWCSHNVVVVVTLGIICVF